ncbi:TetR/AcrR family transcriptional regulator [Actinomadura sp. DC4]|uniref:TetR/AcrR family transcriptional regulator n=1 Tax=Actinomadura sp. DC4 TaxID=3055069 RepID=UPI0025B00187|nr:TetR/AcrR family transcriptional regulator [Actinomadura sp. DC4]MDN3358791.1 TetR/AcrR family transcriptional regulator [Actinomadura sp. DC4]
MPRNTDPITNSVWMRPPRSRRGKPSLSRDQIVSAAIELLDAKGLSGLSMRRLGTKLGAGATSVYWYVANKDELLELAVDEILGEVDIPDPAVVGWRAAVSGVIQGLRSVILRHVWITSVFGFRPAIGPQAMRMSDRVVAVLTAAGFEGAEVAYASSLLMSLAIGSATTDSALHMATVRSGKTVTELVEEMDPYLHRVASDYPSYVTWWSENKSMDIEKLQKDSFDFGLERLLDGLAIRLERKER